MAKRPSARSKVTDPADPAQAAPPKPKRARAAKTADSAADKGGGPSAGPSVDDIRRRAYERYLERGGNHGQHFDDWLEAERELTRKK
jgi:Protein of unknown function (DUF2934)